MLCLVRRNESEWNESERNGTERNGMSEEIINPFLHLETITEWNGIKCDLPKISLTVNIDNK